MAEGLVLLPLGESGRLELRQPASVASVDYGGKLVLWRI